MPTWSSYYTIPPSGTSPGMLDDEFQGPGIPCLEGLHLLPGPTHASSLLAPRSSSSLGLTRLLGCSLGGPRGAKSGSCGIRLWTVSLHCTLGFPIRV